MRERNAKNQNSIVAGEVLVASVLALVLLCNIANADLEAHWKLDGDANDSANAYHGTIQGNPTWTSGVFGSALNFDGNGDSIVGSVSPFNFEDTTFSVAAWIKTTGLNEMIFSEGCYTGGWSLSVDLPGLIRVALKTNTTNDAYSADTVNAYNDNVWHHVAAIVTTSTSSASGNSATIYIDGRPVSITEVILGTYSPSSDAWRIGSRPTDPLYFTGLIDDVRIYSHALTEAEIQGLIPEPATIMLLGLGAIMLRRRR